MVKSHLPKRPKLARLTRFIRREVMFFKLIAHHPQTPRMSRWLLLAALGYLAMPFDLIPDFLPIVGQLDDLLIVPGLVAAALWLIPREVIVDCRREMALNQLDR